MPGGLQPSLVVPLMLWSDSAPTHNISALHASHDYKTLVTGTHDGQLCVWTMDADTFKATPKCLLVGHTAAVTCIVGATNTLDLPSVVSSSANGEMCLWDLKDGLCNESVKLHQIHSYIQAFPVGGGEEVQLFCIGNYAEILVMNPSTLEVIITLSSRVHPDWITAVHVLRPSRRPDTVVLGLTTSGVIKVWTVGVQDLVKSTETLLEHESKQIRCSNAISLTCCIYNQRTVIIVTPKRWQVYDAGDFSLLCSVPSRPCSTWRGGNFIATDRVIVWDNKGVAYMYRLTANNTKGDAPRCVVESKDFHNRAVDGELPLLYCVLASKNSQTLPCSPAVEFKLVVKDGRLSKLLISGDARGRIGVFTIPEVSDNQLTQIQQLDFDRPPVMDPVATSSMDESWKTVSSRKSILSVLGNKAQVTSSLYLAPHNKLVCGRDDGSLVILNATAALRLLLLQSQSAADAIPCEELRGHVGRVTCILYPHQLHPRYDAAHLVSGGADFSLCLWDLTNGSLLHRFCVQAGEIAQLLVTPPNCSARIQHCICSVANDHSVSLVSLKERKCVLLASRHLFPVNCVKWRPLDDFMMVSCSDGTLYVWQMETGHLDRVVHGLGADEILSACDETVALETGPQEGGLANPAVHFFRGLRHRNLAAIRHAAQRGLHQLQQLQNAGNLDSTDPLKDRGQPLMIQGLKTNPMDSESHAVFFDVESLIIQILSEEYSLMSPNTLEAEGLIGQAEYQKVVALTQSGSPDAQKKIADFLGKVKDKAGDMERLLKDKDKHGILARVREGAESMQMKIQSKSETAKSERGLEDDRDPGGSRSPRPARPPPPRSVPIDWHVTMDTCQLLLSLLHAWGLDSDLDQVCSNRLGLARPSAPISFGLLSRSGHMMLLLPTWTMPGQLEQFTSKSHWEISSPLTTNHLLSVVALANTLMSMNTAAMVNGALTRQVPPRKSIKKEAGSDAGSSEDVAQGYQSQIKQGWSLLATLHCVVLPDKVSQTSANLPESFWKPQVEVLARRWQDRCMEIREAAQALLLAELERLGPQGRKLLVDEWAPSLPTFADPFVVVGLTGSVPGVPAGASPSAGGNGNAGNLAGESAASAASTTSAAVAAAVKTATVAGTAAEVDTEENIEEDDESEDASGRRSSRSTELKRRQATAIVLLGVVGAVFGQDVESSKRKTSNDQRKRNAAPELDAFSLASNSNLARLTSKALTYLLLAPPTPKLPAHTALRRAAIDLIGRGFTVWEPYLDVSKVLLALLELCCDNDKLAPSLSYGLPLSPAADSCRTARHALSLIATARPGAFITTMAREVARYNTLQQNAQTLNINLANAVLARAKPEILRVVELLIDKMHSEITDLLVEVVDIVLHCVDHGHLKSRGLCDVFPALCKFSQISHCPSTRRIAVGSRNGALALYELRGQKCQSIAAHAAEITACAFSPDGKNLASYSSTENKLSFWQQAASGILGLGAVQTRCVKTYSTEPLPEAVRANRVRMPKLQWLGGRTVALMLSNGSEMRFNL